jgi:hypothetical protein
MTTTVKTQTSHPEIVRVSQSYIGYEKKHFEWVHYEDLHGNHLAGAGRIDDYNEEAKRKADALLDEAIKYLERTKAMRAEFASFDAVAKKYASIKPIRGRTEDVRPIAERRYAWKRVEKLDDNTYALDDGNHWYNMNLTEDQKLMPYPILWQRREDGDYLIIRNHINDGISVSRYEFLGRYLPADMRFHYDNGKHYVRYDGVDHYLPKSRTTFDYNNRTINVQRDCKIVFKHVDGKFVRANELQPFKTRRVDKEAEKTLKPKMKEMWDWMQIVLPVFGDTLRGSREQYANNMGLSAWWWTRSISPELVKEIIENPEHEHRMSFAVLSAFEIEAVVGNRFEPQSDSFGKFLKLIRRVGNIYATELK